MNDLVDNIIRYEEGDMTTNELLQFFCKLIETGMAWTLQGHYGRTANELIKNGYISRNGEMLKNIEDGDDQ